MADAPNYQISNKHEVCSNCIYGQVGNTCLLYQFQYEQGYICSSWLKVCYLELERPHGWLIFKGKQSAVAMPNMIEESSYLLTSDDEAYGVMSLERGQEVSIKDFGTKEWATKHSVYEEERKRWWPEAQKLYVHSIKSFEAFDKIYPILDGKIVVYEPTKEEKALIEKVSRMPRIVQLEEKAISVDLEGNVLSDINDLRIKTLLDSYFDKTDYGKKSLDKEYPIYSLSLVRKPYIMPLESEKQHSSAMFGLFFDEATGKAISNLVYSGLFADEIVPFGANFTEPNEYHVTLAMLGNADDLLPQMEIIYKIAETLVADYEPIKGRIGGIGRFTERQEDGTVPFYLTFDSPKLTAFREELADRLKAVGIEVMDNHGFIPHITIGYFPEATNIAQLKVPEFSFSLQYLTLAWGGEQIKFPFRLKEEKAIWSQEYLEKLPDENFFYISPEGERHLPYRDLDGNIDYGHIRSALNAVNKLNDAEGNPLPEEIIQKIKDKIAKVIEENPAKAYHEDDDMEDEKAVWTAAYVNDLPDSSFLWVESGGEKDDEGKTKPRSLRHLPYKDAQGKLDMPHLRNAIAQAPKIKDMHGNMISEAQATKLQNRARIILDKNTKEFRTSFMDGLKQLVQSAAQLFGYIETEQENTTPFDIDFTQDNGVGVKTVNGEEWHFTWSANAFMDRDKEIFSTKALEEYVDNNFKDGAWEVKDGYFNFWHIPGTDFAEKKFQAMVGKFLVEAGPYLKDEKGKKAKEFFKQYKNGHPEVAPEGWGASVEYKYLPEEKKQGTYEWTYITRTSTLPLLAASNLFTNSTQEIFDMALKEGTEQYKATAALFGEDFTKGLISSGETKTTKLQDAGIAHKEKEEQTEENKTTEEPPKEEEKKEAAPTFTLEDIVRGVSEQLALNVKALQEDNTTTISKIVEKVTEVFERVKALEEGKKTAEELTQLPRWELIFQKQASGAKTTEVDETDPLASKKPEEAPAEKQKKTVSDVMFS